MAARRRACRHRGEVVLIFTTNKSLSAQPSIAGDRDDRRGEFEHLATAIRREATPNILSGSIRGQRGGQKVRSPVDDISFVPGAHHQPPHMTMVDHATAAQSVQRNMPRS
jgi:hypothetical protein